MNNATVALLTTVIVFLVVVLVARDWVCWYWKINQMVGLQKETVDLLGKLVVTHNAACPECREPIVRGATKCPHCRTSLEWENAAAS